MKKYVFNLILSNMELEYRYRLNKSMDNLGPLGITSVSEDMILNDIKKNYN